MSNPHAWRPPVSIPTARRRWWVRAARVAGRGLLLITPVAGLASGLALMVLRAEVNDAALESAHLQGMAIGQTMCPGGR